MFDGIVVDIVEARPIPFLIPNAGIPIIVPYLAAACVIPTINLKRSPAMQSTKKAGKVMAVIRFEQQMIMVVQNYPGA